MLNLSKEQMERRVALLKELYEEGYRYIGATDAGVILAGKDAGIKFKSLGVWGLKSAKSVDKILFPDVKWEDDFLLVIEEELEKLK